MSRPRALVLRAAGSNCDLETVHALQTAGAHVTQLHVNRALEATSNGGGTDPLADVDLLAIPGGFTYGDDLGAGRILGVLLERRLKRSVEALVARGGLVIGICNGFQALVRAGLLPGGDLMATLAPNASGRFEARWTRCLVTTDRSPWLPAGEVLDLPVAHAEGRLVVAEGASLPEERVALRYLTPSDGVPGVSGTAGTSPARYPDNPSGSTSDVAGLIDETGRVFGLMPHPERNVDPWNRPSWTRGLGAGASGPGAGLRVFQSAVEHLARVRS